MTKGQFAIAFLLGFGGYLIVAWLTDPAKAPSETQSTAVLTSPRWQNSGEPQPDDVGHPDTPLEVKPLSLLATTPDDNTPPDANSRRCNDICSQVIKSFKRSDRSLDWERAPSDKLIAHLQQNPTLRSELVRLAVETSGDKRRFIIAAFTQLETRSQWALGKALSRATETNQRLDGIHLLANPATMNLGVAKWFADRLNIEQDLYVRGAMIKALNQPELFHGDANVVEVLSRVLETETNASVRGEALLAKARLIENPEGSLSESIAAVRSDSSEYQYYGALALEQVITRQTLQGVQLDNQSGYEIGQLVTELMNPEFDDMPADVRKSIDDLYGRFF